MEKYQNNWKKKTHQQQQQLQLHQPKVMQLAAAGPSKSRPHEKALQILPPPPPPPPPTIPPPNNIEKNITITDQNKTKNNNTTTSEEELKLAAIAVSLNVRLRTSDMPVSMQEHALRYTRLLINTSASASASAAAPPPQAHGLSPTLLARSLKKEFDGLYGPAWHCVVGKSFGSFVTHSPGGFVYFSLDSLSFLLFKTEVQLVIN